MQSTPFRYLKLVLVAAMLYAAPPPSRAADPVGKVQVSRGEATATLGTQTRALAVGDPVYQGDSLATGGDGSLVVVFRDDTKFALWHNTRMAVEQFSEKPGSEGIATRIVNGTFRFVSGLIAKHKPTAMLVRLGATATIGVRGTHVGGELEGEAAKVVLLEPEGPKRPTAIVVFNDYGSVDVTEPGWGTTVPNAHSAPTPAQRMRLRNIENLMRSLQDVQRAVGTPMPRMAPMINR